jgi:uncharacterized protein YdaU (DUF1376 family)
MKMNYYPFHVGDYISHTKHLTFEEDIIYRRLLDQYYLHEQPLNGRSTDIARLINMREHVDVVDTILREFFDYDEDLGWTNARADDEIKRFQNKRLQASKAGKISGERRLNKRSTDEQPTRTRTITNVKKKIPTESTKKFQRPTLQQVADYCTDRNNGIDPQQFMDHYEANGWKVGRNSMKDWQASIRTWEKTQRERSRTSSSKHKQAGLDLLKEIAR